MLTPAWLMPYFARAECWIAAASHVKGLYMSMVVVGAFGR
jgi:hypothetical protein